MDSLEAQKRLLKSLRRQRRRIQVKNWFRYGWRDNIAWLFSGEARQEQRRWKQEEQEEEIKFKKKYGLTDEDQ